MVVDRRRLALVLDERLFGKFEFPAQIVPFFVMIALWNRLALPQYDVVMPSFEKTATRQSVELPINV